MTHQTLSMCWPKGILSGKTNTGDLACPHRMIFSLYCPLVHQLVSHCTPSCIPPEYDSQFSGTSDGRILCVKSATELLYSQTDHVFSFICLQPWLTPYPLWHNINMWQSNGVSCGCKFNFFRSCSKTFFRVTHFGCLNLPCSTASTPD